ncbi:MAG: hypothetical protein ACYS8W_19355, partial [Planctomycetota bacterium]
QAAVDEYRRNLENIRKQQEEIGNLDEKMAADAKQQLAKLKSESARFASLAREKIRKAEKSVNYTPFTLKEKENARSRLAALKRELANLQKSAKSSSGREGKVLPAGAFLVEAIRAAEHASKMLRESVEEEAILVDKAKALGAAKVRGDFIAVHARTFAAMKNAEKHLADARKELGISLAKPAEKKIFREELDRIKAEVRKLRAQSDKNASMFRP